MSRRLAKKTTRRGLEAGFICDCGARHKFSAYVYAHYHDALLFTCPKCKRMYRVLGGFAKLIETP